MTDLPDDEKRWTAKRRSALVLSILRDETSVAGARPLEQEYITPYTPEQNGLAERFFRSLKEECVWQHRFETFEEAGQVIRKWIEWYNQGRTHQALDYLSPPSTGLNNSNRWLDINRERRVDVS